MKTTNWLKSLFTKTVKEPEMAEIKDIVTDEVVKAALKSDAVTAAVKTQIKTNLDAQIDAAFDVALTDLLGEDDPAK